VNRHDRRTRSLGPAALTALTAMLVIACGSAPTPVPALSSTATASAVVATASPASASVAPSGLPAPGTIAVLDCAAEAAAEAVCLGTSPGPADASVASGGMLMLTLSVRNGGTTATTPISLLLHVATGALPFGPPVCTSCSTSATQHAFGLEWPPLAPGETRLLTAQLPITASAGKADFGADLYAESLADLITNTTVNGFTPGEQGWTVAVTIKG
jgi:hypothetical protein